MRLSRTLTALSAGFASVSALAHPGHSAPTLHAHDLGEVALIVAALALAVVVALDIRALVRRKRKSRP